MKINPFGNQPRTLVQAQTALVGTKCPLCDSPLLLPIIRPPIDIWMSHCNCCGSEVPIVVMLNQEAWKRMARLQMDLT